MVRAPDPEWLRQVEQSADEHLSNLEHLYAQESVYSAAEPMLDQDDESDTESDAEVTESDT